MPAIAHRHAAPFWVWDTDTLTWVKGRQPVLNAGSVTVTGALTDAQLRATSVPVSGPLTDAQLRAVAVPVSLAGGALEVTQAAHMTRADTFKTRSDTFTVAGSGTTIDASASPMSAYAIQVKGTGAPASAWDVRLEGSLNGVNFTQILAHTNATGDGVVLWTGSLEAPALYFRSRVESVTLGGASNIVVTILGQN